MTWKANAFSRYVTRLAAGALFALAVVIAGNLPTATHAADLVGVARIIDGDTVEIAGERVRLHGIDAPEQNQMCNLEGVAMACGEQATGMLQTLAGEGAMRCVGTKRDRYGRLIAVCYAGERDINALLVRQGWALAYRRYSKDYVGDEIEARANGRGMWGGSFVEPWAWRRGTRLPTLTARDGGSS